MRSNAGSTFGDTMSTNTKGTLSTAQNVSISREDGLIFGGHRSQPLNSLLDEEQKENFFKVDYTHNFHSECLKKWFDSKRVECPVC